MSMTIEVTVVLNIPVLANYKDIKEFVDVEYGQCNGMATNNPLRGWKDIEVIEATWTLAE